MRYLPEPVGEGEVRLCVLDLDLESSELVSESSQHKVLSVMCPHATCVWMLTCPESFLCPVTVQMPYVIPTDAHVFPLTKTQATLAAERTRRMEILLPSLCRGVYNINNSMICTAGMTGGLCVVQDVEQKLTSSTLPVMNCLQLQQATPKEVW